MFKKTAETEQISNLTNFPQSTEILFFRFKKHFKYNVSRNDYLKLCEIFI